MPVFQELKPYLEDHFDQAEPGTEFVLAKYRSPNGAYLRKRLDVIREKAGLRKWPRITHNLRASRQSELVRENPVQVVCAIMGNTPAVAHRHYIQVSEADILKAAGKTVQNVVQNHPVLPRTTDLSRVRESRSNPRPCRQLRHGARGSERAAKTAQREWMGIEPT